MVVSNMVLANIKQGERESLRDYTNHFFAVAAEAEDVEPAVAMHNFRRGLRVGDLSKSLQLAKPRSYPELVARASQFMLLEDAESSPAVVPGVRQDRSKRKHRGVEPPITRTQVARPRDREEGRPRHTQPPKLILSRPLPEVYAAAVKQGWIRPTGPRPVPPPGVDPNDYCEFHGNYGHRLHRCRGLRILLEKLLNQGKLEEFMQMAPTFTAAQKGKAPDVAEAPTKALPSVDPSQQVRPYPPATRTINAIFNIDPTTQRQGTEVGGVSEQYASSIPLTFCSEDLPRQGNLHNVLIVVVARIADFVVRRVLLDSRSAADILFESAFLQMGLKETNLLHAGTTLLDFSGERVQPLGFITLPVSFGDGNGHAMSMVNFAIIRAKSGYNAILGRTTLNSFRMVISTPHLCAKFPTSSGVVTFRGDAIQATRCFQIAAQLVVDQIDPRETRPVTSQEGVISVALGGKGSSKVINVSSFLNEKQQTDVTALLLDYIDVFAWSPEDVIGMDRAVCEHHLNVSQGIAPIAQKKRVMIGKRQDTIKEEVTKLLGAGYIREVQYPR
ncbi:hypothetical protein AXF42_Ash020882 [Apostasia shenzhenica]|uniref:Retrotransposon gag domain-containing protein n=1 Tax=Apostasia shenzhenica TaxID=1088818 RepID=A0A2H9ZS15_9ASPA|nr:hypothetical protein AXF42_Ash020882 [Apostasia shenzhenica]